jgi:peptide chain release factor 2
MADPREILQILDESAHRLQELRDSLESEKKKARLTEIEARMAAPDFWSNQEKAQAAVGEMKALKAVLDPLEEIQRTIQDGKELLDLAQAENDQATLDEVAAQGPALRAQIAALDLMALLSGPHDRENCYFSLQVGAGGNDACEWTETMLRMYAKYFERKGWKFEELDLQAGEEAGLKSVSLRVSGAYAYGYLRGEMGVHRLVRISPFSGKRETSFAAVDVTPDFEDDSAVEILEKDLKVDTFRSSGKGGQHVNKTDSAVRLTHLPTGIVVSVQNERSQHRNRDMAMKILKAKLIARQESERAAAASKHNAQKMDNAFGSQIRNYVLHPYQLVKDVRTETEVGNAQKVLDGDLDLFIDAYLRRSAKGSNG